MNSNTINQLAVGKETISIRRDFSDDELDMMRQDLVGVVLKREDEEESLNLIKKDYKVRIDELKAKGKELATNLRLKFVDETHELYKVPNFEAGEMEYFDIVTGEMMHSRRLRPDEKQIHMNSVVAKVG